MIGDRICQLIAEGNSLRFICKAKNVPSMASVFRWLAASEVEGAPTELVAFREQYARARAEQMEAFADELVELADGADPTQAGVAYAKLQIDTRKWVASKLLPKKYGDRIEHAGSGPNGEHVVNHNVAMGNLPAAEGYRQMLDGPPKK